MMDVFKDYLPLISVIVTLIALFIKQSRSYKVFNSKLSSLENRIDHKLDDFLKSERRKDLVLSKDQANILADYYVGYNQGNIKTKIFTEELFYKLQKPDKNISSIRNGFLKFPKEVILESRLKIATFKLPNNFNFKTFLESIDDELREITDIEIEKSIVKIEEFSNNFSPKINDVKSLLYDL